MRMIIPIKLRLTLTSSNWGDSNDLEDIFEPKRKENSKEEHNEHLDNLEEFLGGFGDEELQSFLWDRLIWRSFKT